MSLAPALAMHLGRSDAVRGRGLEGRGSTNVSRGQGRVYGAGTTAAGLAASSHLGGATTNFSFDTGTISVLMMAGIVVGVVLFYRWTRSAQA